MTVAALPSVISYVEDGASVRFPVPFRFKSQDDLIVDRILGGGVEQRLRIGIDYTVSGGETDAGGEVLRAAAANGATLRIRRDTQRAQPMVYATGDRFPAASHEDALDRQMLVAQEQDAAIGDVTARSFLVPVGEEAATIPPALDLRDRVWTFDAITGQPDFVPKGSFPPGPPGGNVMAVSPFVDLRGGAVVIPEGARRVRTAAFRGDSVSRSVGAADYVRDPIVTAAYAAANPLTSFRAPNGAGQVYGYRIDEAAVTPQQLGARDDGSATIHSALLALSSTAIDMIVPPGDYLIDNSVPRQISFFRGSINFAPGARLIFTDSTRIGLFFFKGSPRVHGVTCTTRDDPALVGRQDNAALLRFDETTNAICSDVVIERSAGAGILVREGVGFGGDNISIENTLADGFDFFNHAQGRLSGLRTFNTGDDGLGCVSYLYRAPGEPAPQGYGLTLSDIQVRRSRTRGVSFIGYKDCVLTNVVIDETQGDGIIIERDDVHASHTPTSIRIADALIHRPGQLAIDANYSGERHGLKIGQSGSVYVTGVEIVDAKSRGVSATSSEANAHLHVDNVRVEKAGAQGFFFFGHRSVTYGTISAQDTGAAAIQTFQLARLIGDRRIAIRGAMMGAPYRAVWDQDNLFQDPGRTVIEDLAGPATGFTYRVEGNGRGTVGLVEWNQSGAYYTEFLAPYMSIPSRIVSKRDDVSPGVGAILLSPYDAWHRKIYDPITADITVGLPLFGMAHGDEVSITRYDGSGTFLIGLRDRNNGDTLVTSIPPGAPMINRVRWDAVGRRWRAAGKMNL